MKYSYLVETYQKFEDTSKRLEKTYYISELLRNSKIDDLPIIMLLLQGRVFPKWDERKIGVASRLIVKAISIATGMTVDEIDGEWKKAGDLGLVAGKLIAKKKQVALFSSELTVKKVYQNILKVSEVEGHGSVDIKTKLIAELLTSAKPIEARYIVRTVLEELRVGVGEGSIRDAIVWAFFPKVCDIFFRCGSCGEWMPSVDKCINCEKTIDLKARQNYKSLKVFEIDDVSELEKVDLKGCDIIIGKDYDVNRAAYNWLLQQVQEAIDITNDFSKVAVIVKEKGVKGLQHIALETCKPLKVMLYQKAKDIEEAFEAVGKPACLEFKYDGFRLQLHRNGDKIKLYTRNLEDVTEQFPDVAKVIKEHINSANYILDSEVIGIDPKTKKWLPFQSISQRIKRKYDIHELVKQVPVMVNVFDAMQINNENLLKTPFEKRRKLIASIVKEVAEKLQMAKQLVTDNPDKAEKFYKEALAKGNEGIMVKSLSAPYKPGSRVGYGMKVKPVMETLDLVIVGADWGEGKRSNWLSSFTIACVDDNGNFLEIGKVGTGFKEKKEEGLSFAELTEMLKPLIISEKGKEVRVKPKIVIEINYEEIQKSPTYSSRYALRFPRLIRLRIEKPPEEVSTLAQVEELYGGQRERGSK